MPYVAKNYLSNPSAPMESWVCTRTSALGPFKSPIQPPSASRGDPNYCGQCVSFATTVCTSLPVSTLLWKKGKAAKGNADIKPGTVIATFTSTGKYLGHTAIYHDQTKFALNVYDQWVTGHTKAIGKRALRFGAAGISNNGDGFYVVE